MGNGRRTVKAIATGPSLSASTVAGGDYTTGATPAPALSPAPGNLIGSQNVTITDSNNAAAIYYTTNGQPPTSASKVYSGPIAVDKPVTIQAIATVSGKPESAVAGGAYTVQTAPPQFAPAPGIFDKGQNVVIFDGASTYSPSTATIYYTLDGKTPTLQSTHYTKPISISSTDTIQAIAYIDGQTQSDVGVGAYIIATLAKPSISPAAGSYTTPQQITMSTGVTGASIDYTTDGTTPTSSSFLYKAPFTIGSSVTINAITYKGTMLAGDQQSMVATAAYTIEETAPAFSPAPGTYYSVQKVTLSDADTKATIYFTTDGTKSTLSSPIYTTPITISQSTTISALAKNLGVTGAAASKIVEGTYTIQGVTPAPTFSPTPSTSPYPNTGVAITLADSNTGAAIYYTVDGTPPSTSSALYTVPFTLTNDSTVLAFAVAPNMGPSAVQSATYYVQGPTPTFSPIPSAYATTQTVTISDSANSPMIYYTTDGTTPSIAKMLYTGPITVNGRYIARSPGAGLCSQRGRRGRLCHHRHGNANVLDYSGHLLHATVGEHL